MQLLQLSMQHFELGLDKLEESSQKGSVSSPEENDELQQELPNLKSQLKNLIQKVIETNRHYTCLICRGNDLIEYNLFHLY